MDDGTTIGICICLIMIFIQLRHNLSLPPLVRKWIHFLIGKDFKFLVFKGKYPKLHCLFVSEILIMLKPLYFAVKLTTAEFFLWSRGTKVRLHELFHSVPSPMSRWAQNAEASGGSVSQMLLMEFAPAMSTTLYLQNTPVRMP